jgi:hypothetical protein
MFSLIQFRLKELFSYKLLIIVLFICPVIFGYFSSYALSERIRDFGVAVYDADGSAESKEFMDLLIQMQSLNITKVENKIDGMTLTNSRTVEGMLKIKHGFGIDLKENGRNEMLEYTAAPGTNTSEFMSEAFSLALIHMRTEIILIDALSNLSEQAVIDGHVAFSAYTSEEPVVTVVYHNEFPDLLALFISPRHGLAAVFMTLSFLISIFMLPGREKSFLSIYGSKALIMDYSARFTAVLILFLGAIALYFAGCMIIYDARPLVIEVLALAALAFFCIGLGAAAALFTKDKRSGIYIYIPFLLLNMTTGGAVWGRMFEINMPFKIILPTAVFLDACVNNRLHEAIIMAVIGLALLFCGMYLSTK